MQCRKYNIYFATKYFLNVAIRSCHMSDVHVIKCYRWMHLVIYFCLSVCDYHRGFVFGASGWVSLSGSLMSWLLISFARFQAKQAPLSLITPNPLSDVNLHITHMHTHLEDAPEWKQTVVRVCWRMMDKNGSTFEVYFGTNTLGCDGHQSFSWFLQD